MSTCPNRISIEQMWLRALERKIAGCVAEIKDLEYYKDITIDYKDKRRRLIRTIGSLILVKNIFTVDKKVDKKEKVVVRTKPNVLRQCIKREAIVYSGAYNTVERLCYAQIYWNNIAVRGYSYCDEQDSFDPGKGIKLAERRALEGMEYAYIHDELEGVKTFNNEKRIFLWRKARVAETLRLDNDCNNSCGRRLCNSK